MRFATILSVAAFAGAALAQNQSGQPGAGCAGQNVLIACLGSQAGRIAQCKTLDYACMCQIQADVLQCYDQCPNDINRSTEQSKLTAYCVAASAAAPAPTQTSASTFVVQTTGSSASPTETGDEDATPTDTSDGTSTETDGPTGTKSSNGKAATSEPAGSSAAKITWMCASSLMAVLTAAFMAL
ncbi:hypothetical protein TWF506_003863 [Arthrobotrys conoides]|uniref:GPI anchored serine-threonine rich protein n=1 Tax=Arthrobotrys conoides TaxID=74498 RepID=A0AAN8RPN1_9PEZI